MDCVENPRPIVPLPSAGQAQAAIADSRRLFGRTLERWASDVLILRHAGMLEPKWRDCDNGGALLRAA